MDADGLSSLDREFVRRACDGCGGSLDVEVGGEEIGHDLGLDEQEAVEVVARLTRTGFLRDVGAHLRIKITIRSLALVMREGPDGAPAPTEQADAADLAEGPSRTAIPTRRRRQDTP